MGDDTRKRKCQFTASHSPLLQLLPTAELCNNIYLSQGERERGKEGRIKRQPAVFLFALRLPELYYSRKESRGRDGVEWNGKGRRITIIYLPPISRSWAIISIVSEPPLVDNIISTVLFSGSQSVGWKGKSSTPSRSLTGSVIASWWLCIWNKNSVHERE